MKKIGLLFFFISAFSCSMVAQSNVHYIKQEFYNGIPTESVMVDLKYAHVQSVECFNHKRNWLKTIKLDKFGRIIYYRCDNSGLADSFTYAGTFFNALLARKYRLDGSETMDYIEYRFGLNMSWCSYKVNKNGSEELLTRQFNTFRDSNKFSTYYSDGSKDLIVSKQIVNDINYFSAYDDSRKGIIKNRIIVYSTVSKYDTNGKRYAHENKYAIYSKQAFSSKMGALLEEGILLETRSDALSNITHDIILSPKHDAFVQRDIDVLNGLNLDSIKNVLLKYRIPLARLELKHRVERSYVYDELNRLVSSTKNGITYVYYYNKEGRISKVVSKSNNEEKILTYTSNGLLQKIELPLSPEENVEYAYTYFK